MRSWSTSENAVRIPPSSALSQEEPLLEDPLRILGRTRKKLGKLGRFELVPASQSFSFPQRARHAWATRRYPTYVDVKMVTSPRLGMSFFREESLS